VGRDLPGEQFDAKTALKEEVKDAHGGSDPRRFDGH
jgi:hypothetical protein